jgi:hypothetical protein
VHVYKLCFLCEQAGPAGAPDALETVEIGWFALDNLPELSPGRITARQLERMIAHHRDPTLPTEFD